MSRMVRERAPAIYKACRSWLGFKTQIKTCWKDLTMRQRSEVLNSIVVSHGVATLFGYGIAVRVDRGHLLVEDGIGAERKQARFARVGHGLKRLVLIGSDGMI